MIMASNDETKEEYVKMSMNDKAEEIINAYENFIDYLKNKDSVIDHVYLWDMVCFADRDLIKNGLNLVIIEIFKNSGIKILA